MRIHQITRSIMLLILVCYLLPFPSPGANFHRDEIQSLVGKIKDQGSIPAMGLLMAEPGQTPLLITKGVRAQQFSVPVDNSNKWHLGSDTKAMTAFLVALAVQEAKLSYSSLVSEALGIESMHIANLKLTVDDLLVHSSQLKDVQALGDGETWPLYFNNPAPVTQQRRQLSIQALKEAPEVFGAKDFNYANINYVVLGAILESVYQKPWEQIIAEKLFQPLNMLSCGFGVAGQPGEEFPSEPWPHVIQDGELIGIAPEHKADNPEVLGPAGRVHCNLEDWYKFLDELILTYNRAKPLKERLLYDPEVASKYFSAPEVGYPYSFGGWGFKQNLSTGPILQHTGSNTMNYASALLLPAQGKVLLMTMNAAHSDAVGAFQNLFLHLLQSLSSNRHP